MSRGEYGAAVGVPRILGALARHSVKATFFVPGHSADHYPGAVEAMLKAGHEVAAHGYLHESPVGMTMEEETAVLEKGESALQRITGGKPAGYRSPAWDLSENTIRLLRERGYRYDSSLMADDFMPFHPREHDVVGGDGAINWGPRSSVVEFPVAWELDDFPYFSFLNKPLYSGLRNPSEVFDIWLGEFKYCAERCENGVFVLTMHPEIVGRGPRIEMLERLIAAMSQHPGVRFMTMAAAAQDPGILTMCAESAPTSPRFR